MCASSWASTHGVGGRARLRALAHVSTSKCKERVRKEARGTQVYSKKKSVRSKSADQWHYFMTRRPFDTQDTKLTSPSMTKHSPHVAHGYTAGPQSLAQKLGCLSICSKCTHREQGRHTHLPPAHVATLLHPRPLASRYGARSVRGHQQLRRRRWRKVDWMTRARNCLVGRRGNRRDLTWRRTRKIVAGRGGRGSSRSRRGCRQRRRL